MVRHGPAGHQRRVPHARVHIRREGKLAHEEGRQDDLVLSLGRVEKGPSALRDRHGERQDVHERGHALQVRALGAGGHKALYFAIASVLGRFLHRIDPGFRVFGTDANWGASRDASATEVGRRDVSTDVRVPVSLPG